MGCQSSTPLKNETPAPMAVAAAPKAVAVAAVKVEAAPVAADLVFTKISDEETLVKPSTFVTVIAPTTTALPVVSEEAPKADADAKKRRIRRKKAAKTAAPVAVVAVNDENAPVAYSSAKATASFAPITAIKTFGAQKEVNGSSSSTAPKRVAFSAKTSNIPAHVAPKVASTSKNRKHKNVEHSKVQEMTMAFQRLLTHADHLDAHLSTRNTYSQKA